MKFLFSTIIALLSLSFTHAQFRAPSLSPKVQITQTIGYTDISFDYSRPSAKGRQIFATNGLLPYNALWRTGANAATKISFSDNVNIANQKFEKGDYTIISIPNEKEWEIRWYPYTKRDWTSYQNLEPYATITQTVTQSKDYIETLEIGLTDIALDKANLTIAWETTLIQLPIKVALHDVALKRIEKTMAGPSSTDYYQAALYLQESKADLNKALEYIQKVTASDKALFFQVTREALILDDLGKLSEAKQVAKRGLELSKKANNSDFVRMNEKILAKK